MKEEKNIKSKEYKKHKNQRENIKNKTRRPSVLTFTLFLVLIIVSCILVITEMKNKLNVPTLSEDTVIGNAESDVTTIQFKDVKLYNKIKSYNKDSLNLKSKIQSYNDTNMTITMTGEDVKSVTSLSLNNNFIKNISGIEKFTNLTDLDLSGNQISDINVLNSLTNLTELILESNQISDISALSSFTNLTNLDLSSNQISDISALSEITSLTNLDLLNNPITHISALYNLTNLTILDLGYNSWGSNNPQISDISALGNLTNLTSLNLTGHKIDDISALSSLTNLTELKLENNQISDISALSNLTKLTYLQLNSNQISDISGLSNLTKLTYLQLNSNQISDITPLKGLSVFENNQVHFYGNKSTNTVSRKEYKIPSIIMLRDKDEIIKDVSVESQKLGLVNCTLSEDGTSVILNSGLEKGDTVIIKTIDINGSWGARYPGIVHTLTVDDVYIDPPIAQISYSKIDPTIEEVIATISFNKEGVKILNNEGKNTYSFDSNGGFIFEFVDENGNVGSAKATVSNIDKTSPEIIHTALSKVTQNSFSLDIKGKDKDSGVSKIRVYVNNELKKTYEYSDDLNAEKQEVFTIDGLTQDTKYTYYVEVEDVVGNISSTKGKTDEEINSVTTAKIQELETQITNTVVNWTNDSSSINITPNIQINEGLKLQYMLVRDDGTVIKEYTDYIGEFKVEENCVVKTRLTDGINVSNEKTYSVANIDKVNPVVSDVSVIDITSKLFKLKITGKDEHSGVSKIRVYVNDELKKTYEYNNDLNAEKQEVFTIDDLTQDTKYTYYVEVEDKAHNIASTKGISSSVTTKINIDNILSIIPSTKDKTDKNVSITIEQSKDVKLSNSPYIEYQILDLSGNVIKGYTKYESAFEVDKNCIIEARITDGTETTDKVTYTVNNITSFNVNTSDKIYIVITILILLLVLNLFGILLRRKRNS